MSCQNNGTYSVKCKSWKSKNILSVNEVTTIWTTVKEIGQSLYILYFWFITDTDTIILALQLGSSGCMCILCFWRLIKKLKSTNLPEYAWTIFLTNIQSSGSDISLFLLLRFIAILICYNVVLSNYYVVLSNYYVVVSNYYCNILK